MKKFLLLSLLLASSSVLAMESSSSEDGVSNRDSARKIAELAASVDKVESEEESSTEKKIQQLSFSTDAERKITEFFKQNMEFGKNPKDFIGDDILHVFNFNEETMEKLLLVFDVARQQGIQTSACYSLEDGEYLSEITPMNNENGFAGFNITVTKK